MFTRKKPKQKTSWTWGMDSLQLQASARYQNTILPFFHTNIAIVKHWYYKLVNSKLIKKTCFYATCD